MRRLTAAGAVAAAALGTMAPALPAGAAATPEPTGSDSEATHCVVQAATGRDPRTQTTLGCFDSFAEAQNAVSTLGALSPLAAPAALAGPSAQGAAAPLAAGSSTLAWHFEHHGAGGASVIILGSSCASTWYPSSWWRTNLSSTVVGPTCAGAKHYTLTSCAGSYQIASLPYNTITNLLGALNDHVGCVKYQ